MLTCETGCLLYWAGSTHRGLEHIIQRADCQQRAVHASQLLPRWALSCRLQFTECLSYLQSFRQLPYFLRAPCMLHSQQTSLSHRQKPLHNTLLV